MKKAHNWKKIIFSKSNFFNKKIKRMGKTSKIVPRQIMTRDEEEGLSLT